MGHTAAPRGIDPGLLEALRGLQGDRRRDPRRVVDGRVRLMAAVMEARQRSPLAPVRAVRWRRRLAFLLVVVAGVTVVAGALVLVSAGALPDSRLYGARRATEAVELRLTFDAGAHARLQMGFAGRRVDEAVTMVERGRDDLARAALGDAQPEARDAVAQLRANPGADSDRVLRTTNDGVRAQLDRLVARWQASGDAAGVREAEATRAAFSL